MEKPGLKYQESVSAFFKLFSRKLYNLPHLLLAVSVTKGDSFGLSLHDSKTCAIHQMSLWKHTYPGIFDGELRKEATRVGIRLSLGQN